MTIKELEIVIPIAPVPASRARSVTGRAAYYLPKYNEWRKTAADVLIRLLANEAGFGGDPVAVEYEFVCTRPKKPSKPWPRGDWDNYAKAVQDALTTAGVWDDDSQVVEAFTVKRYADGGEPASIIARIRSVTL